MPMKRNGKRNSTPALIVKTYAERLQGYFPDCYCAAMGSAISTTLRRGTYETIHYPLG